MFHVVYNPERVTPAQMLEAIQSKGFRGELRTDSPTPQPRAPRVRRELGRLPPKFGQQVEEARKAKKPLLIAFHGDGCLPCQRMDAETYPNATVKSELSRWVFLKVDVAGDPEIAAVFEVSGIPVAVAVTADGEELGRIENFVEPEAFHSRLNAFLSTGDELEGG